MNDFYSSCSGGLKQKLGCVLFQIHPQIKYSEEFLKILISSLNHSFKNVVEFRDASWWNQTVYKTLEKHKTIFSGVSYPKLPGEIIITKPDLYYRFHGVPVLYKSAYEETFLEEKFLIIQNMKIKEAWFYFNNTWGTAAILNGKYLQRLFERV